MIMVDVLPWLVVGLLVALRSDLLNRQEVQIVEGHLVSITSKNKHIIV
jgi:hypothetical protein